MNLLQTTAVFFGASPLGTALLLSLILTLAVLTVARLSIALSRLTVPERWRRYTQLSGRWLVLIGAFASFSLGVWGVATLTEGLTEGPAVAAWDQQFVVTAHAHQGETEVKFFHIVTQLAGRAASIILGFGIGFYLLYRKDLRMLSLWTVGLVGNSVIIQILKQFYERPRPGLLMPYLTEENFSFPSGHASASVLMYGLLAYLIYVRARELARRERLVLVTSVVWLGVLIGTSRLALGVHYPTDVLAGWSVAISWLGVLICADRLALLRMATRKDTTASTS